MANYNFIRNPLIAYRQNLKLIKLIYTCNRKDIDTHISTKFIRPIPQNLETINAPIPTIIGPWHLLLLVMGISFLEGSAFAGSKFWVGVLVLLLISTLTLFL